MNDQGQYDDQRRRYPSGDGAEQPSAGRPYAGPPGEDDPMAALEERLQAMSPSAARESAAPPPRDPAPAAAREPRSRTAPPAALAAPAKSSRGRRRPAARRRSSFSLARIAAPVVFLVAVVVIVALVFQSGIVGGTGETPTPTPTPRTTKTQGADGGDKGGATVAFKKYTVKDGDTLSGIAVKYHTTVNEILALNPKMSTSTLVVGATVRVPKPAPSP